MKDVRAAMISTTNFHMEKYLNIELILNLKEDTQGKFLLVKCDDEKWFWTSNVIDIQDDGEIIEVITENSIYKFRRNENEPGR